jgi:hypothetical protein
MQQMTKCGMSWFADAITFIKKEWLRQWREGTFTQRKDMVKTLNKSGFGGINHVKNIAT